MNTAWPYLRDTSESMTLADLPDTLPRGGESTVTENGEVSFVEDRDLGGIAVEFPVGSHRQRVGIREDSMRQWCDWLEVPAKFVERQDPDLQALVLTQLAQRAGGEVLINWTEQSIRRLHDPGVDVLTQEALITALMNTMPEESTVVDINASSRYWDVSVALPENHDRGVGGDRQVGDITLGGIKAGIDMQHGKAPWLESWLYRLVCTNGMEVPSRLGVVEIRGNTVPEIIEQMETAAQNILGVLDHHIESFYAMRSDRIDQATADTVVRRLVNENSLPIKGSDLDEVQDLALILEDPTMFDLVNLITHQANNPALANKPAIRRRLEIGGGRVMLDHAARCSHCQTRIS